MKVALVNSAGQFVKLFSKSAVVHTDKPSAAIAWSQTSSRFNQDKAKIIQVSGEPHAEVAHPDYQFVTVHEGYELLERLSQHETVQGDRLFRDPQQSDTAAKEVTKTSDLTNVILLPEASSSPLR